MHKSAQLGTCNKQLRWQCNQAWLQRCPGQHHDKTCMLFMESNVLLVALQTRRTQGVLLITMILCCSSGGSCCHDAGASVAATASCMVLQIQALGEAATSDAMRKPSGSSARQLRRDGCQHRAAEGAALSLTFTPPDHQQGHCPTLSNQTMELKHETRMQRHPLSQTKLLASK